MSEKENETTLLRLLTDIRFALGDDGKRMQDEFVEYCKALKAERDMLRQLHRHALNCVDQVFQECTEIPHPLLPGFARLGEDKFECVIRLAKAYIEAVAENGKLTEAITIASGQIDAVSGRTVSDDELLLQARDTLDEALESK